MPMPMARPISRASPTPADYTVQQPDDQIQLGVAAAIDERKERGARRKAHVEQHCHGDIAHRHIQDFRIGIEEAKDCSGEEYGNDAQKQRKGQIENGRDPDDLGNPVIFLRTEILTDHGAAAVERALVTTAVMEPSLLPMPVTAEATTP